MVAGSCSHQLTVSVSVARLWKAVAHDDHNLAPKVLPELIASAELVEGDGGAGSIKVFKFSPAVTEASYVKQHVAVLDDASHTMKYKVIEGGLIGKKLKSQCSEVKLEASGADSCVVKFKLEYDTIDDTPLTEEEEARLKQPSIAGMKAIEAHLVANPGAYA